jgi:hypothetical protein
VRRGVRRGGQGGQAQAAGGTGTGGRVGIALVLPLAR